MSVQVGRCERGDVESSWGTDGEPTARPACRRDAARWWDEPRLPVRLLGRAAVVGLMLAALAGCAETSRFRRHPHQDAFGAYLRGLMHERSAEFHEALDAYQFALEHDRQSAHLHVRLGATYVKLGQPDRALRSFAKALALNPRHADALRWTAMLYTSQGKFDEATATYERLRAVEPADRFVLSTLADLYTLQGELDKAIALYQDLIREVGSSSQLHFNLGVLDGRIGRFDEAIQELSRAYELSPDTLEVRVALGITYELNGQHDHAAAHYEEAIQLDPRNPRLYHYAARAHLNGKRLAEAAEDYRAVLALTPEDLDAIVGLMRVHIAQGEIDQAQTLLVHALDALEGPAELYVALGILYREAQAPQEAIRAFERAIAKRADYAQAYFYLGSQLDQLGRRVDARAQLHRTIALDPNHADALNYLGYLDAEEGVNLSEAKGLIERALALDPDNGAYVDSLGWVYYKMGRLEDAITQLERAARLLDTDPVVFDHLGDAYVQRNDVEKARANWERALRLDSSQATIQQKLERLSH